MFVVSSSSCKIPFFVIQRGWKIETLKYFATRTAVALVKRVRSLSCEFSLILTSKPTLSNASRHSFKHFHGSAPTSSSLLPHRNAFSLGFHTRAQRS